VHVYSVAKLHIIISHKAILLFYLTRFAGLCCILFQRYILH